MTYATPNYTAIKTHDSLKTTFKSPLSSTDIAALKTRIESNYRVAFLYTGLEFDYEVTVEGTDAPFKNAMNTLFPKGRNDIVIQPAHYIG